ncbi:MAG: GNAT family N-acetyltransferase [Fimbriimonadaceae bacterium]|nr:GNAT family N-acetyltransferase [Fimbriimonadaceae bacterium]
MSPTDGVRFREYTDAQDREQAAELLSLVYRSGEPLPEDRPLVEGDGHAYVAERDGRILAYFEVLPMRATMPRHPVRCAGIAAVAVRPEARGGGLGREMMRWSLPRLRERGYAMASLYAFRESFYRPVGYEVVGRRFRIVCPQSRLPSVASPLEVRAMDEEGWTLAAPVYEAFASNYSGMNLRSPDQWKTVTRGTGGKTRLFVIGDPAEAYAVVHLQSAFWEQQAVSEVAWSSGAGYNGLLAFFRSLASNKSALAWYEPGDSPFLARSLDQGVQVSLERWMTSRVLDVPTVLAALQPAGEGSLGIDVLDPELPENAGQWTVSWSEDGMETVRGGTPEASASIGALTQAAHGEPCAEELVIAGVMQCQPEARRRLQTLFPRGRAYCMDFF